LNEPTAVRAALAMTIEGLDMAFPPWIFWDSGKGP
jgi:hypothetical protein